MPPKKTSSPPSGESSASASSAPQGLTEGELRFIKAVFDNMTQKPDADWDAVAAALTLKDAKCAKERFRQMSVRHGWRNESSPRKKAASASTSSAGADAKVTRKPRAPRKRAAAAVKKNEDEDEDGEDKVGAKAEVKDEGSD